MMSKEDEYYFDFYTNVSEIFYKQLKEFIPRKLKCHIIDPKRKREFDELLQLLKEFTECEFFGTTIFELKIQEKKYNRMFFLLKKHFRSFRL